VDEKKKLLVNPGNMEKTHDENEYEFGGPFGALLIMLMSHFIPFYLWHAVTFNNSSMAMPNWTMMQTIWEHAKPNAYAAYFYGGFIAFQFMCALIIPGFYMYGVALKHENGKQ
jgi:delta24(24(1))-sterol reductase